MGLSILSLSAALVSQDLSIAGKRAGLDGARSGLFHQAIRIIKEMREVSGGEKPRYAVYENVEGIFSSNAGEDFRRVLEEICWVKDERISVPRPDGRWAKAGEIMGDGFSVAWRVFDAAGWGVPQRRKRIYLVADFDGESAGEVLFKSEGLSGYTPQGFRSWQGASGSVEESTGATGKWTYTRSGNGVTYCMNPQGRSGLSITEDQSGTLIAHDHGNHPSVLQSAGFSTEHSAKSRSIGYEEERSPTLRAGVVPAALNLYENHSQDSRYRGPLEVAQPVTANYGMGGNNQPLVVEDHDASDKSYAISRIGFNSGEKAAFNFAVNEEISPTLETGGPHAVAKPEIKAFGVCGKNSNSMLSDNPSSGFYEAETSRTLDCNGGRPDSNQGGICILAPTVEQETYDVRFTSEGTKNARGHCYKTEISRCLDTSEGNPDSNHGGIAVVAVEGNGTRPSHHGSGFSESNVSYTLNATETHCVAYGIDRAAFNQGKNAKFGISVEEELEPPVVAKGPGAVAHPDNSHKPTYSANKASFFTAAIKEKAGSLVASDYKDPPIVNDEPNESNEPNGTGIDNKTNDEPMYIVRRLTPTECARLQGFPDKWCAGLEIPDPTDEEIAFWKDVWEEWRHITNPNGKPKTEKQIRKWLASPYTDAASYKLWGNGVALPNVYFVLSGIVWAYNKELSEDNEPIKVE